MASKITMEDKGVTKEVLNEMYIKQKMTLKQIGFKYGINRNIIKRWLLESDIEIRFNNDALKIDYFDEIDSEEKAYWLGFIWCDGSVNTRQVGKYTEYTFSMDLCEKDHLHLYKFRDALNANNKIEKLTTVEASFTSEKWRYRIRIKNASFCKLLLDKYNMIPYRFNVDKLREFVPHELMRHFIRGVIDADGSVIFSKGKNASVSFAVTYDMGKLIRDYFLTEGLIKREIQIFPVYIGGLIDLYNLTIGGNLQITKILEHVFVGSNIFMTRKHEKALHIIKINNNKILNKGMIICTS